jgi:hypothetical protein
MGTHDIEAYGFENGFDCFYGSMGMRLEYLSPTGGSTWAPVEVRRLNLCGR